MGLDSHSEQHGELCPELIAKAFGVQSAVIIFPEYEGLESAIRPDDAFIGFAIRCTVGICLIAGCLHTLLFRISTRVPNTRIK